MVTLGMFLHSLRIHQRNSPAAMSGVYRYTVSPPLPAPPLRPRSPQQQRLAHEKPVIFWSLLLGLSGTSPPLPPFSPRSRYTGPAMVVAVPPLRRSFGYKAPEPIPTTFPGEHAFLPPRALSCRSSILYRLTVRPKQCPTDLDDQSRGTRTNKKAWITCMVVYS